jgi:hypothetical protein
VPGRGAARVSQYELAGLTGLTAEHYDEIVILRHQTNEVFRQAVARGVDDGTFAAADVNRVVRGMLSLSIDLVRWYRLDGSDSPAQLGDYYADLALKMIGRARPGEPVSRQPTATAASEVRNARRAGTSVKTCPVMPIASAPATLGSRLSMKTASAGAMPRSARTCR